MRVAVSDSRSTESRVLSRIRGLGRGAVVIPTQFLDCGTRTAVDVALHRLTKRGVLRRVSRGIYHFPETHPTLGTIPPSIDAIAEALKERFAVRLQPSGAYAANLLGLSDQVPMRVTFLTDGPSRKLTVGGFPIHLCHTTPRNMATAGKTSGLVIQALRWMGKRQMDEAVVNRLRKLLRDEDKRRLPADARFAPEWVARVMRLIARPEES